MSELANKEHRTIKISDLSVGDWVEIDHEIFGWQPAQINVCGDLGIGAYFKDIDPEEEYDCTLSQVRPIPITAEILEKNGWFRLEYQCVWDIEDNQGTSHDGEYVITWYADDEYLTISWGGREDEVLVERTIMECRVKYIHQLQHTLRLAGVDKEINL